MRLGVLTPKAEILKDRERESVCGEADIELITCI